jgi:uncharacterized protein with PQ loop repeat
MFAEAKKFMKKFIESQMFARDLVPPMPSTDKYYYSYIIAILVTILGLFYYLNEMQNIFKIKNTKYEIFMWLFLVAFSIYTFLSYVYKHNYNNYNNNSNLFDCCIVHQTNVIVYIKME